MKYAILIYTNEAGPNPAAQDMGPWAAYTREVTERGVLQGGAALQPTSTATTVRVNGSKTLTTDGPFAETREQLGGFYLLECKDLDEAIEYAAKIPSAPYYPVEVRPVMELDFLD